jgi:phosphonoacetaldehyde hydrolase
VLDWSGTVADNWVTSVSQAFVQLWKEVAGIEITMAEARAPMGLEKSLHNAAIAAQPRVATAWQAKYGKPIGPDDLRRMFRAFIPIQLRWLKAPGVTDLIPGVLPAIKALREKGMNIGVTTGFQREFANVLLSAAKTQGFYPDVDVAADEANRPRPFPDMMLINILGLKAPHVCSVLKVDDTRSGIGEGLSAGCWTCGVSHTSVYMNIDSHAHRQTLSDSEYERRGVAAREILLNAGAHYVVDDIRGVPAVAALINRRLAVGCGP